ncbi:MAG: Flagellar P-ring protein [Phycisphaerae bacterium]|nr:Flagellar P-ring protein [Phycisphaerae bacterium]
MKRVLLIIVILLSTTGPAWGQNVPIGSIARFKGPRINQLQGFGLVVGLNGTGDSDYQRTIEPLANVLKYYANPVENLEELAKTKNVAAVMLQATLPEGGIREGERVDVQVMAIGNCKNLQGGKLLAAPLQHHALVDRRIMGFAMGDIQLPDAESPVTGVIRQGLTLEEDVMVRFMASGADLQPLYHNNWIKPEEFYVTLVIDETHEGNGMAAAMAEAINADLGVSFASEGEAQLAMAMDPKNVVVRVPHVQVEDPVPFMRDIEALTPLLPERGARVLINRTAGFIAIDGEVRISPVMFAVGGLNINIVRATDGQAVTPTVERRSFFAIDPGSQGGPNLAELLKQLDQIQVPIADQITAIEELHRMGKIHAQIMYVDE